MKIYEHKLCFRIQINRLKTMVTEIKNYILSTKYYIQSFICKYTSMYDIRYPLPAAKKDDWWYIYASIV